MLGVRRATVRTRHPLVLGGLPPGRVAPAPPECAHCTLPPCRPPTARHHGVRVPRMPDPSPRDAVLPGVWHFLPSGRPRRSMPVLCRAHHLRRAHRGLLIAATSSPTHCSQWLVPQPLFHDHGLLSDLGRFRRTVVPRNALLQHCLKPKAYDALSHSFWGLDIYRRIGESTITAAGCAGHGVKCVCGTTHPP